MRLKLLAKKANNSDGIDDASSWFFEGGKFGVYLSRAGVRPVIPRGLCKGVMSGLSNNWAIKIFNCFNMKILWRCYRLIDLLFWLYIYAVSLVHICMVGTSLSIIHPLVPGTVREVVVA
ncbi:hypothetical protein [Pseudomonas sp. NMI760_13]|uniref:hypothetical protein n=1 Tax=Pseudomonas sp. NMI760_13 TaxID=2903147 RepID=UPI001E479AE2|nr:hypothetical protein [Pseudomonas sp. NMI760_13]MCE0916423.1 hypothetical protein [Pseudomonas sp. NMI760_13]